MNHRLETTKRMCTGLTFIIFPTVFVFAFAVHPDLLEPGLLTPTEIILRARGDSLLQFGHVLVLLNTALLIGATLHFTRALNRSTSAVSGFVGGLLATLGAIMLAADKGALCLTMSALDTLPDKEFAAAMPGILAMFDKEGWMVLLWGLLLLPLGFSIQAIALLRTNTLPRWQALLLLISVLLIGTPDGLEIVNLTAAILMAIALIPYGVQIITGRSESLAKIDIRDAW